MIVLFIFFVNLAFFVFLYKRHKKNSFLFLPLVMLFIEMIRNLFSHFGIEAGISGLQASVLFLYVGMGYWHYFRRPKNILFMLFTWLFILYLSTRINFSTDTFSMITRIVNFSLVLSIFPLVRSLYSDFDYSRTNFLIIIMFRSAIYFVVYVFVCSLFKIGPNMYSTNLIYGFEFEQWYYGSLLVACYPLFRRYKVSKIFYMNIITIVLILILILTLRRLALVVIFSSTFVYFIYNLKYKFNFKVILFTFLSVITGVLAVFFTDFYKYRESRFSDEYELENEGRYVEWFLANEQISNYGNSPITGTANLFNEVGNYGFKKDDRNMHSTYTKLLYGSGYLGMIWFGVIILVYFLSVFNFKLFRFDKSLDIKDFRLVSFGIILTYMFIVGTGASGLGSGVSYVVFSLIFAGMNGFTVRN